MLLYFGSQDYKDFFKILSKTRETLFFFHEAEVIGHKKYFPIIFCYLSAHSNSLHIEHEVIPILQIQTRQERGGGGEKTESGLKASRSMLCLTWLTALGLALLNMSIPARKIPGWGNT